MRIGIDVTHLPWDNRGMGRYVRELLPLLLKDSSLSLVAFSARRFPEKTASEIPKEIKFEKLSNKCYVDVEASKVDMMWFPWNVPSFSCNIKSIVTIHDVIRFRYSKSGFLGWYYTGKEKRKLQNSAKYSSHIIADAEFSKQEIMRFLSVQSEKITVIPLGVDCNKFFPRPWSELSETFKQFGINAPYLLYAGAIQPSKNIELLLNTYITLFSKGVVNQDLVLAGGIQGEGSFKEQIFNIVSKSGLTQKIYFLENVSDEFLPLLYSGADLFVFPSEYEGFGLPPLEAMASGVPVVTSNAASLPEVVGDAAIKVDIHSNFLGFKEKMLRLADACSHVIQSSELRNKLIKDGLKRAKIFSWERTASDLIKLFHNIEYSRDCFK